MKMEQTECFETSAHKIQIPGNLPSYTTYEDGTDNVSKRRRIKFRSLGIFLLTPPMKMEQSVSKRRRIKFRSLGIFLLTSPMKMEQTECFETSAHRIKTQRNLPAYTTYEDGTDRMFRNVGA